MASINNEVRELSSSKELQQESTFEAICLKDIFLKNTGPKPETECYVMQNPFSDKKEGEPNQITILVHRIDLNFNDTECQVLNFTDVTMFQRLEKEKETTKLLKTLTASVSHEMIAPLNSTIEIAEMLLQQI